MGNICSSESDVIVTSANCRLDDVGAGVNFAIHDAAGPFLKEACKRVTIDTGSIFVTNGFELPSQYVFHTSVPEFRDDRNQIWNCYSFLFSECYKRQVHSIAIPALGTGKKGFPKKIAAKAALWSIKCYISSYPFYKLKYKIYFQNIDTLIAYNEILCGLIKLGNDDFISMEDRSKHVPLHLSLIFEDDLYEPWELL